MIRVETFGNPVERGAYTSIDWAECEPSAIPTCVRQLFEDAAEGGRRVERIMVENEDAERLFSIHVVHSAVRPPRFEVYVGGTYVASRTSVAGAANAGLRRRATGAEVR